MSQLSQATPQRAAAAQFLDKDLIAQGLRGAIYDFALFDKSRAAPLADRRLNELTYVVFDTETTGLLPSQGDEIVVAEATEDRVNIEMAAHGGTVIEIRKVDGKWQPVLDGAMNRRITALTPMEIHGPVRGSDFVKTLYSPNGTMTRGDFMLNLAKIWAGLPTATGRSYYKGVANNKATISWDHFYREITTLFPGQA